MFKFSFRTKLILTITLLCVTLSSLGMWTLYSISYNIIIERLNKDLVNVGRLGSLLFDEECLEAIKRLTLETETGMQLTLQEVRSTPLGEYRSTLNGETIAQLQASDDFQLLLKKLRLMALAAANLNPTENIDISPERFYEYFQSGIIAPYLIVKIEGLSDWSLGRYLAITLPEPLDDGSWPGCPIGTIGHMLLPIEPILQGGPTISTDLVTDDYYTCLASAIPLQNKKGELIAVLGLDYAPKQELNKLTQLRRLSVAIVTASGLLALLLALYLSKRLSRSLYCLQNAATAIEQGNYQVEVPVTIHDEFGAVAITFNNMTAAIRTNLAALRQNNEQLENKVEERTKELKNINKKLAQEIDERRQAQQSLLELSEKDSLTGLANRRKFDSAYNLEWKAALRETRPLSILMIDIDSFKNFNDHYGHPAGDNALQQVASSMKSTLLRPRDLVARYGGEEFICLLPETSSKAAVIVAENLRSNVEKLRIQHQLSKTADVLTISIGISTIVPSPSIEAQELLSQADIALYQAKGGGKNRFVVVN